jgi:hypothetical protein
VADLLRFRRVTGEHEEYAARVDDVELPAGDFLTARMVWLEDGTSGGRELRQHRPVAGDGRAHGYARLDSEILAGRRLYQVAGRSYPPELARLHGDEATTADPYALYEPYRGEPLHAIGEMYADEFERFVPGLLAGLCWLAGAGIAHRAISPATVYWDGDRVQITGFSRSVPFGMSRTPLTGSRLWVALESRPEACYGTVGPSDDVWAAVRLIYFARSRGKDLTDLTELEETGLAQMFNGVLPHVFGPPETRPTAIDLIEYGLRQSHLIPSMPDISMQLRGRRAVFLNARGGKHPQAGVPDGFWDDVTWRRSLWGTGSASSTASSTGGEG